MIYSELIQMTSLFPSNIPTTELTNRLNEIGEENIISISSSSNGSIVRALIVYKGPDKPVSSSQEPTKYWSNQEG